MTILWRRFTITDSHFIVFRFIPTPTTAFMWQRPYPVDFRDWISMMNSLLMFPLALIFRGQRFPNHFTAVCLICMPSVSDKPIPSDGDVFGWADQYDLLKQTAKISFFASGRSFCCAQRSAKSGCCGSLKPFLLAQETLF